MKRAVLICLLILAATGIALSQDDRRDDRRGPPFAEDDDEVFLDGQFDGFDVLPLSRAADLVEERFTGKLIAARLVPPFPWEHERGAVLVHELRLLTPRRDVLIFRLDARSGAFLDIAGTGLTEARRPAKSPGHHDQ